MKNLSLRASLGLTLLGIFVIALTLFSFVQIAQANPTLFQRFAGITSSGTATATTTRSFMTPGTATTTYYADVGQGNFSFDSAVLATQYTASSTGILNFRLEYAHDTPGFNCVTSPTACDWYSDNTMQPGVTTVSTTTDSGITYTPNVQTYNWKFASSTDGCSTGLALASVNRTCRLFTVQTPTRYVRAVFFVPPGTTNSAVWAEFITQKEVNSN